MNNSSDRKPDFGRLKKALFLQGEPDWVPLAELGIDVTMKEFILGRPIQNLQDEVDFAIHAGYDYVKLGPGIDLNPGNIKPKEGNRQAEATEHDSERVFANEGQGIITCWEDFERYQWPKPEEVSYRNFESIASVLPDEMGLIGQYGDIFTQVWMTMGFEAFSFAQIEHPELIKALFDKFGGIIVNLFENMAQFDRISALWYSDDIAYTEGLMVSPNLLRTHLFPYMKRIGDICREKGIPFLYHSDGVLYEVLDDLQQCGINALHPVEPKAMDIVELKKKVAGRFCLIGNVELDSFLCRGTPETVEQEVKRLIRDVAPGGGYSLGSSNTVPRFVKKENYRAMIEACKKYGRYPIDIPM